MAREAGIDLVEVAPTSVPPVCRLMDYGKFKYEQKKKAHKAKVKQRTTVLKEVRLRPKTNAHDREVKLNHARDFLRKGDKVQFTMLFRGRELAHLDLAMNAFQSLIEQLSDVARVEQPPKKMGRRMNMVLVPEREKPRAAGRAVAASPPTEAATRSEPPAAGSPAPSPVQPTATQT